MEEVVEMESFYNVMEFRKLKTQEKGKYHVEP